VRKCFWMCIVASPVEIDTAWNVLAAHRGRDGCRDRGGEAGRSNPKIDCPKPSHPFRSGAHDSWCSDCSVSGKGNCLWSLAANCTAWSPVHQHRFVFRARRMLSKQNAVEALFLRKPSIRKVSPSDEEACRTDSPSKRKPSNRAHPLQT
jgi:hypothetical protein